jgi:uncharacterized protein
MRLVVLILLIVLAVWLIRRAFLTSSNKSRNAPPLQGDLVACARCGMHLPRNEAREAGGRLYCGEEHARLGAQR